MSEAKHGEPPKPAGDFYNPVFERLEASEHISGAVAYALYKIAKREWVTDFKAKTGARPTDVDMKQYSATQTDAILNAYRANAERIIGVYAEKIINDQRPIILREALAGGFFRSFWPSFVASIAFSALLLLIIMVAALLGFGLPIQINFPPQ